MYYIIKEGNFMNKCYCRLYQKIMKTAAVFLPWRQPEVISGQHATEKVADLLKKLHYGNVLVVTDKVLRGLGLLDPMLKKMEEEGIQYFIFDEVQPNPSIHNVEAALKVFKDNKCEAIVAFGGGSVMDCAKVTGARFVKPKKPISKMRGQLKILKKLPTIIAIPTTAGTGSETTLAAVITDPEHQDKYAINDTSLIPPYAILDPVVTKGLPKKITSTTGMDALTHAVEAYIGHSNTKETRRNAKEAVKLIFENVYEAYSNGENLEARENMLNASYKAGVAFTRAYVGYVHALAHALGGFYGTPHGLANAVLLPYVLEEYGESAYKPLSELYDVVVPNSTFTRDRKAKEFIKMIKELNAKMEIPPFISDLKAEDIDALALHAYKEANPLYPVPEEWPLETFKKMYKKVLAN